MNITRLEATNLKGRNFALNLAPATLIYGPNYSGKTAIATALRLAVAGHLPPPIGKRAGSIYAALAGNPDAPGQVEVKACVGLNTYSTRWIRNSSGGTTCQGGIPPSIAMPAVLVDPRTFFAMTGPERVQAIFEACDVKLSVDDVVATIKAAAPAAFPVKERQRVLSGIAERAKTHMRTKAPQVAMADLIEETREAHRKAKESLRTMSAIIQAINWTGDIPEDCSLAIEDAQKRINGLHQQIAEIDARDRDFRELAARIKHAKEAIGTLRAEIELTRWPAPPVEPDTSKLKTLEDQLRAFRDVNIHRRAKRAALHEKLLRIGAGACPTCGCSGPVLDSVKAGIEAEIAAVPPDHANLTALEDEIAALRKLRTDYEKAKVAYGRDSDTVTRAEKDLADYERIAAQPLPPAPDDEDIEGQKIQAFLNTAKDALSLLTEGQARWEAYQQTSAKRDEAERTMAAITCEETVLGEVIVALRGLVSKTVDAAFGKVLGITKEFTDGILRSPLEYRDELGRRVSQEDVDAGCTAPIGSWISHEAFSGTEEALSYAAFAVAIAMRAPVKVVILDELGRLDSSTVVAVLGRMTDLVYSGRIDQFIGIHTTNINAIGLTPIYIGEALAAQPCQY